MKLIFLLFTAAFFYSGGVSVSAQKDIKPSFNHFAVYIHDLNKSNAFYKNVMLLDTIPEPFKDGRHTWYRIGEHSQLHVIQGAGEVTSHDRNSHLCFTVSSVDNFIIHLGKMKIKYSNSKGDDNQYTIRTDGVKQIYLQDPDGYWIEINDDKF